MKMLPTAKQDLSYKHPLRKFSAHPCYPKGIPPPDWKDLHKPTPSQCREFRKWYRYEYSNQECLTIPLDKKILYSIVTIDKGSR